MADNEAPDTGAKKTMGLDRRQWMIVGAAVLGGVVWFWWRSRQAAAAANQTATSDTSATDTTGMDTGAVTPYPVGGLTADQLAQLEADIAALHGPPSTPPGIIAPGPGLKPPSKGGGTPVPTKVRWTRYNIVRGDTPARISKKEGVPWPTIWNFNVGPNSPHSAQAKQELRTEGPSRLKSGQWLAIPGK